ncbi:diguanylate cyclase [Aquabacter sp. CN5-332]|uniref:diguanylate cyclase n=1 Tax=Aquabacter sp. CN5-332 TaxID=3156608 RepID=UPI0032B4F14B
MSGKDQYAFFARILDSIDIAVCLFDSEDRAILWNRSFLRFFPEHDGHVHEGEPYRENLRRFYDYRLKGDERELIDHYISEGIDRHRNQTRPFVFIHRGRRLRVASLPTKNGGRIRLWQDLAADSGGAEAAPAWQSFPIDLLDHIADGAMVLDQDDKIIAANKEFRALYNVPPGRSVIGATLTDIVRDTWATDGTGRKAPSDGSMLDSMRFAGAPFEIELPGGQWRRVIARRTENGIGYFSHSDISVLKRQQHELLIAERRAREEEYRYRLLAENSNDVIIATSADLVVQFVSPAVNRVLGWSTDKVMGASLTTFIHEDDHAAFSLDPAEGMAVERHATFTCRVRNQAGSWIWMEASMGVLPTVPGDDRAIALVCSLRDATERVLAERALKLAHDELSSIASTDGLTGLANRRRFDTAFDQEWRRAGRDKHPICLLLIDVDHFKAVNDRHGHVVGDECLRRVASLIQHSVHRPGDVVARYGGEEFAVLLPNTPRAGATAIASKIRTAMALEPWGPVHPGLASITVSMGLCCVHRAETLSMAEMLRTADEALYRAKNGGRDRIEVREVN